MSREQLSYGLGRLAALARQRDWVTGEAAGLTPTQGDTLRLLAGGSSGRASAWRTGRPPQCAAFHRQ